MSSTTTYYNSEIQTINNLNYQTLQNPGYLDADKRVDNKEDIDVADIDDIDESTTTAQNSNNATKKPRGNYGGAMKGGT